MDHNMPLKPLAAEITRTPRRRIIPLWVWIVLAINSLLVTALWATNVVDDRAVVNLATMVIALLTLVILMVWFAFFSRFRRRTRMLALAGCVLGAATFFALFRVDQLSGSMVPSFTFRFAKKPDRLLGRLPGEPAAGAQAAVDLRTTGKHDFPQFLGPLRSEAVEEVGLAHDWSARPPRPLWRQAIGAGWSGFSVVNGHAVTLEQRGEEEMVTCYNVKTGQLEWAHAHPARFETIVAGIGPRSTPTIDEGMVYAMGATGWLMCLDGATGQARWEKDLYEELGITAEEDAAVVPHGRSGSPLIVRDMLIVPGGGRRDGPLVSLIAFRKQDGTVIWKGGDRQISYCSPASATLGGVEQVLIVNQDYADGYDLKTGKFLWEYPWPGKSGGEPNVSQAVPLPPDRVFLSKAYGRGAAVLRLTPQNGKFSAEAVWTNRKALRTKFTNVTIKDGYVYGLSDEVLECVALDDGRSVWKKGRYGSGQILRADDLLLVMGEEGEMAMVEAAPGRSNNVWGRFQALDGKTWNNIALAGPYLLVRNAEQAACYELPLEATHLPLF
jgi:outer membrane protein assembly factor BamB